MKLVVLVLVIFPSCASIPPEFDLRPEVELGPAPLVYPLCDTPIGVRVAPSVPQEHREAVQQAFDYWMNATGIYLFEPAIPYNTELESSWFPNTVTLRWDPTGPACAMTEYHAVTQFGCSLATSIAVNASCVKYWESPAIESIMRHELGHVLGLGHSGIPLDVMFPIVLHGIWVHPQDTIEATINLVRETYHANWWSEHNKKMSIANPTPY
jgi:hypothetical protein